jgi:hypothetical protein
MSIIFTADGVLYSDSQGEYIEERGAEPVLFKAQKLFTTECKRLAYGVVGKSLSKDTHLALQEFLIAAVRNIELGKVEAESIPEGLKKYFEVVGLLVISAKQAYVMELGCLVVSPVNYNICGSVFMEMRVLLNAGVKPLEALEWVFQHNPTVSGPVCSISSKKLKPMISQVFDEEESDVSV